MSAVPKISYANQFQPLFQPYGTGSGSTGPTGPASTVTGPTGPANSGDLPSQVLQYAVPSGTPGGAAPGANAYYTRPINQGVPALTGGGDSTVITGLNLTADQITLPAGTYAIQGSVVGLMTTIKSRLFDVTNNTVVALGLAVGADGRNNESTFYTEITIAAPTLFEVQFCGAQNFGLQDYGQPCNFGDDEIYLQMLITKEA